MNFIFIEAFRVQAWVGIYPRERATPQMVEFDLSFGLSEGTTKDDIVATIDYTKVIESIRDGLYERHFNLIETLGEFVADLLCNKFGAPWAKVKISKIGVMKDVRRIGVCVERGNQK